MFAFNVYLHGKLIDTVFSYVGSHETIAQAVDRVRTELIDHDGYSHEIRVTWPKGQRVTETVYELQGLYSHGWECLCSEKNMRDAKTRKREYLENEGGQYRIVRKMERKG